MNDLIYIVAWFILPLIPAFILFKFLPSTGNAEGPLKGLALKFGGAFAGYLILFLVSYNLIKNRMKKDDDIKEVWTIKGNITSQDNKFIARREDAAFKIEPQDQHIRNKAFDIQVIALADGKGYLIFPKVDLTSTNYQSEPLPELDFNRTKENIDTSNYVIESFDSKIIRLKNPVVLRPNFQPAPDPLIEETLAVDTSLSHH